MTDDGQVLAHEDGATATIVLQRPAKLNALTPEMLGELEAVVATVAASAARVVVVRGAGDRAFCVGADIHRFAGLSPAEMWRTWTTRGHRAFAALATLPQPSVAVVHGHAFGGGLELALACDLRVMAAGAQLALPEVGLGTVPGWGGTERLTELVGRARAKEVVLAGRRLDAATAYRWGLVTDVAEADALDGAVDALVAQLGAGAPVAVQIAKQLIDAAADGAPSSVLEPLAGGLTAATEDLRTGVAAFAARETPRFSGR